MSTTQRLWVDRVKDYPGGAGERLRLAMQDLPVPGAFREAAVALRKIIRGKRKAQILYTDELWLLYRLAAVDSFMLPYAERLKQPGYSVIRAIPRERLCALSVDYNVIGYAELTLLNRTDKKWIVEAWGRPEGHSTLNQVHRALWDEYEDILVRQHQEELRKLKREFAELLGKTGGPSLNSILAETGQSAARLNDIVNESMAIARKTRNPETRLSRLRVAVTNIERLKELAAGIPELRLDGLADVEAEIASLDPSYRAEAPPQLSVPPKKRSKWAKWRSAGTRMVLTGVVAVCLGMALVNTSPVLAGLGAIVFLLTAPAGLLLVIVARIGTWWHHG